MLAIVDSAVLHGVTGRRVTIEVHNGKGIPGLTMVGLPDAACREARDRTRSAILSSELEWPQKRLTINLAPSSFPKQGSGTDLAIAVGVVAVTQDGPPILDALRGVAFLGELGLDGSLRPVAGTVAMVAALRGAVSQVVVPTALGPEAALVPDIEVRCADTLRQVVGALEGTHDWTPMPDAGEPACPPIADLADVRGQPVARRVLEIAAAGGHHLLLSGPPGAGKTMLASRLVHLLPDLDDADALDVTAIHSAAGHLPGGHLLRRPPYRAPHHTASVVSLVGGGASVMRPGEISLAHRGVLFADELGEFPAAVLDALRQPLEDGAIRVSRAAGSVVFPAGFQLVAATNPCPCGPTSRGCRCSEAARARYRRRISGPLLDRFDLRLDVHAVDPSAVLDHRPGEATATVRARVEAARAVAIDRAGVPNASLRADALVRYASLSGPATHVLMHLLRHGQLTARGVARVRRVARTIADLEGHVGLLRDDHVTEAATLRAPVLEAVAS